MSIDWLQSKFSQTFFYYLHNLFKRETYQYLAALTASNYLYNSSILTMHNFTIKFQISELFFYSGRKSIGHNVKIDST